MVIGAASFDVIVGACRRDFTTEPAVFISTARQAGKASPRSRASGQNAQSPAMVATPPR
jgi:hypothetical protein